MRDYYYHEKRHFTKRQKILFLSCFLAGFVIALIVGNVLKANLSDEKYAEKILGETAKESTPSPVEAPFFQGRFYSFGESKTVDGCDQFCFYLNEETGELTFTSAVATQLGYATSEAKETVDFGETMRLLTDNSSRLCGMFYAQYAEYDENDERYAEMMKENALFSAFSENGGDEIVLFGLDLLCVDDICDYLSLCKTLNPDLSFGVVVSVDASNAVISDTTPLQKLENAGAFLVFDMTNRDQTEEPTAFLTRWDYFRSAYPVRFLFAESDAEMITYCSDNGIAFQAVSAPAREEE